MLPRTGPISQSVRMRKVLEDARRLREGQGLRCTVTLDGLPTDAFVVRYRGQLHAYVNRCRHLALPLDFGDAHFFDEQADALVCVQHGARYEPATGRCISGPCAGASLTRVVVEEREGAVWCGAVEEGS